MVAELVRQGQVKMAIAVLIAMDCYLRPSELLSITSGSLVPPSPESGNSWALLLHPSSKGALSKVGESDETLLLNSRRLTFLRPALEILGRSGSTEKSLWSFDYSSLYKALASIGRELGIALVPYIMRHSGVTIDRATGERSQEEAQKRGRWKQASSMRRYEKAGRLGDSWRLLRPEVQQHCRQMASRLAEFIVGGAVPPRIPPRQRR